MTLTCTYDHRIIQGAESGAFLGKLQALLDGKDGFYEEIFEHLRMPHMPVRWETDRKPTAAGRERGAICGDRQGSGDHPDDQRVPRARASDRGPGSAGRRAELPCGAGSGDLRADHLGSGSRIPHRQPGRGDRRRRAETGGHAARDSGDAAPDLLRQNRLRVHEHPGAGAEALAAAAHGAGGQQLAAGYARRGCAFCAA